MRSLMLGDCNHYASPYMRGVADASSRLGIEHYEVSIRQPIEQLARVLGALKPDLIWTHMLLWPPPGAPPVEDLVALMEREARRGARIVIHDGDCKERTRHPHNLAAWCSLALVNHGHDRSAWGVPVLGWPYFAAVQERIADADPAWNCDLFFAGQLGTGPVYAARSALLEGIRAAGVKLRQPTALDGNTLSKTPTIAASADAVLGFGRPEATGWVDTRVFQYPGAGGILVHDDAGGYLEPWVHFVPYQSGSSASVVEALGRLRAMPERERRSIRERAFAFVQRHHNSIARVHQVLRALELPCA